MTRAFNRTTSQYDIFECLADDSLRWETDIQGLLKTRRALRELFETTAGEYFALQLSSGATIFHCESPALGKRVLQIAYAQDSRERRARLLRRRGYGVLSVLGNSAARNLLRALQCSPAGIGLFVIGDSAPTATRNEMVHWLKSKYSPVKVLALNPPDQVVSGADLNVPQNGPDLWLTLVPAIMGGPNGPGSASERQFPEMKNPV